MEQILKQLVAFPTVTGDQTAMHQLLSYVAGFVAERGMHVEWFESNGFESIVATTAPGRKNPTVMLAAHADVVPATDDMFELRAQDDTYVGRGVLDMKLALAAYLTVIDDLGTALPAYDIGLMVTGDEEAGGHDGVKKLVDEGYLPSVCILPDGGDNWQVQTASKGLWLFNISMRGVSAHGSRHWQGDNAITKLLAALDDIQQLFPPDNDQHAQTNTISLNVLNGGLAFSQVPDEASMIIDIRTMDSHEHARLYDQVTAICRRHGARYQHVSDCAPTKFELTDPWIAPFADIVTTVTGVPQTGFCALGASDARYYVPFGVPCISVYPRGGDIHSDREWVGQECLGQFRTILRQYLDAKARPATD